MSFDSFLTSGNSPGKPLPDLELTLSLDRRASLKKPVGGPTSPEAV